MSKQWLPIEISAIDMAFPATVSHLMPSYEEIPKEFKDWNGRNKWVKFQSDWFFSGLKNLDLTPKDGIDSNVAMRHLKTIQASFEPQHEHKEAAIAYLASLWFDDVKYEKAK